MRASLRRSERGERGSLEDGRSVGTDRLADVDVETVVRRMVGRDASAFFARAPVEIGDTQFEVRGVSRRRVVSDVSFEVRRGEIFGIGGIVGSGRTELAGLIFGADRRDAGTLYRLLRYRVVGLAHLGLLERLCRRWPGHDRV